MADDGSSGLRATVAHMCASGATRNEGTRETLSTTARHSAKEGWEWGEVLETVGEGSDHKWRGKALTRAAPPIS